MLDDLQWAFLILFLVTSMAGIGLRTKLQDLRATLRQRGLVLRSLVANFVVVPVFGLLLTKLVPMPVGVVVAILLVGCAPGGISAFQFTSKRTPVLAFAGTLAFLLTGLSILVSPLLMAAVLPAGISLVVPYAQAFWYYAVFLLLPLGLGVLVCERADRLADGLANPMALIGTISFVIFVVLSLSARQSAMAELSSDVIATMLGFILVTMIVGWVAGGPDREIRQVLASATSVRNAWLCLAIVNGSLLEHDVRIPLIAFSALMIPPNLIYLLVTVVLNKRRVGT